VLDDGTYDVFVIDAQDVVGNDDAIRLELTVISGPRKGEVVAVVATQLHVDAIAVLGLPATLIVENASPRVELS